MHVKRPVLARSNPSNSALLSDGRGLIFSTPEEFIEQAKQLLDSPKLYSEITTTAYEWVERYHSVMEEASKYQQILFESLIHYGSCNKLEIFCDRTSSLSV